MKNFKFNFKKFVVLLIFLFLSFQVFAKPPKKEILTLNNSIIYDLFLNYELTQKNGNLSTITDFMPNLNQNVKYKSISFTSNIADVKQNCEISFNENGTINSIVYDADDTRYRYNLIYDGNQLTTINISNKPKISFQYDKKGRISSITRQRNSEVSFEYNFEYLDNENKANIKLIVIENNKRTPGSRNYYLTWNSNYRLESYCFDSYCSKNIQYTPQGDLLSYTFSTANADNILSTWDYISFDDKQNWTERQSKKFFFKRKIEYY